MITPIFGCDIESDSGLFSWTHKISVSVSVIDLKAGCREETDFREYLDLDFFLLKAAKGTLRESVRR